MIADGIDEDLRLALQTAKGLRVHDPVAVALKRRPEVRLLFKTQTPPGRIRAHRPRRKRSIFLRAPALLEGRHDGLSGRNPHEISVLAGCDGETQSLVTFLAAAYVSALEGRVRRQRGRRRLALAWIRSTTFGRQVRQAVTR